VELSQDSLRDDVDDDDDNDNNNNNIIQLKQIVLFQLCLRLDKTNK